MSQNTIKTHIARIFEKLGTTSRSEAVARAQSQGWITGYTMWLKPRSVLNIVIGGFAGTCAVLSGAAAVSSSAQVWAQPGVIILGLLIFLWTPTHFWSLALMYRQDYARVSMPMLPVRISPRKFSNH